MEIDLREDFSNNKNINTAFKFENSNYIKTLFNSTDSLASRLQFLKIYLSKNSNIVYSDDTFLYLNSTPSFILNKETYEIIFEFDDNIFDSAIKVISFPIKNVSSMYPKEFLCVVVVYYNSIKLLVLNDSTNQKNSSKHIKKDFTISNIEILDACFINPVFYSNNNKVNNNSLNSIANFIVVDSQFQTHHLQIFKNEITNSYDYTITLKDEKSFLERLVVKYIRSESKSHFCKIIFVKEVGLYFVINNNHIKCYRFDFDDKKLIFVKNFKTETLKRITNVVNMLNEINKNTGNEDIIIEENDKTSVSNKAFEYCKDLNEVLGLPNNIFLSTINYFAYFNEENRIINFIVSYTDDINSVIYNFLLSINFENIDPNIISYNNINFTFETMSVLPHYNKFNNDMKTHISFLEYRNNEVSNNNSNNDSLSINPSFIMIIYDNSVRKKLPCSYIYHFVLNCNGFVIKQNYRKIEFWINSINEVKYDSNTNNEADLYLDLFNSDLGICEISLNKKNNNFNFSVKNDYFLAKLDKSFVQNALMNNNLNLNASNTNNISYCNNLEEINQTRLKENITRNILGSTILTSLEEKRRNENNKSLNYLNNNAFNDDTAFKLMTDILNLFFYIKKHNRQDNMNNNNTHNFLKTNLSMFNSQENSNKYNSYYRNNITNMNNNVNDNDITTSPENDLENKIKIISNKIQINKTDLNALFEKLLYLVLDDQSQNINLVQIDLVKSECNILNYLDDKIIKLEYLIEFFDKFSIFDVYSNNNSNKESFESLHITIIQFYEKLLFAKNLRLLENQVLDTKKNLYQYLYVNISESMGNTNISNNNSFINNNTANKVYMDNMKNIMKRFFDHMICLKFKNKNNLGNSKLMKQLMNENNSKLSNKYYVYNNISEFDEYLNLIFLVYREFSSDPEINRSDLFSIVIILMTYFQNTFNEITEMHIRLESKFSSNSNVNVHTNTNQSVNLLNSNNSHLNNTIIINSINKCISKSAFQLHWTYRSLYKNLFNTLVTEAYNFPQNVASTYQNAIFPFFEVMFFLMKKIVSNDNILIDNMSYKNNKIYLNCLLMKINAERTLEIADNYSDIYSYTKICEENNLNDIYINYLYKLEKLKRSELIVYSLKCYLLFEIEKHESNYTVSNNKKWHFEFFEVVPLNFKNEMLEVLSGYPKLTLLYQVFLRTKLDISYLCNNDLFYENSQYNCEDKEKYIHEQNSIVANVVKMINLEYNYNENYSKSYKEKNNLMLNESNNKVSEEYELEEQACNILRKTEVFLRLMDLNILTDIKERNKMNNNEIVLNILSNFNINTARGEIYNSSITNQTLLEYTASLLCQKYNEVFISSQDTIKLLITKGHNDRNHFKEALNLMFLYKDIDTRLNFNNQEIEILINQYNSYFLTRNNSFNDNYELSVKNQAVGLIFLDLFYNIILDDFFFIYQNRQLTSIRELNVGDDNIDELHKTINAFYIIRNLKFVKRDLITCMNNLILLIQQNNNHILRRIEAISQKYNYNSANITTFDENNNSVFIEEIKEFQEIINKSAIIR